MKKAALGIFLLAILAMSFAVGLAADYPNKLEVREGGQTTYGIRVYNTLNQTVSFRIVPVSDTEFVRVANAQEVYVLEARQKQEINFIITVPEDQRDKNIYNPKYIVAESVPNNVNTMIDTAVSPEFSFSVKVLPKPTAEGTPTDKTAITITPSEPAKGQPKATSATVDPVALAIGLVFFLGVSFVIYYFAEKRREEE